MGRLQRFKSHSCSKQQANLQPLLVPLTWDAPMMMPAPALMLPCPVLSCLVERCNRREQTVKSGIS